MKQLTISEYEEGQRLDRLLEKLFLQSNKGFIYKMLRKKNITLNGKRAEGNEILRNGDLVSVFFSDETYEKLTQKQSSQVEFPHKITEEKQEQIFKVKILYEDKHVLVLHKPAGMLSQKASDADYSMVEYVRDYLLQQGSISKEQMKTFRPGVCNRLDRNTEGLVVAGKTTLGLQTLSKLLRDRTLEKYYLCVVKGMVEEAMRLSAYLIKDEKRNQVTIGKGPDGELIETEYRPIAVTNAGTLLEVKLITGKSHQIRAHLASIGHPIAGDVKYGDEDYNQTMKMRFGVRHQMLIAYRMKFPRMGGEFVSLSQKEIRTEIPEAIARFCKTYAVCIGEE